VFASKTPRNAADAVETYTDEVPDPVSPFESRFRIIQIDGPPGLFEKLATDIFYPPEAAATDFPIAIHTGALRCPTIVYMITRMGYLHLFDLESADCIYTNRVSESTVFASVPHTTSGGIMCLNREGHVLLISVNHETIVDYVRTKLGDDAMAVRLAGRNGFRGADAQFIDHLEDCLEDGDFRGAALAAANSPEGFLRTRETVLRFQEVEGDPPPALIYFQTILSLGSLNEVESQLLALQLIHSSKVPLLEKWIREDKLFCSEILGDHIRSTSPTIAMAVYIKAKSHDKVMQCMVQTGQTSKVALYAKKVGMKISHRELVDMAAKHNPQAALEIANNTSNALVLADDPASRGRIPLKQVESMVDMFLSKGMLNEATAHAMEALRDDDPAEGPLQTRILKACLANAPQVADGILSQDIWHQYDRFPIAMLCERIGLFQHALDNYTDFSDVKRVITNTHVINPDFIANYFATVRPEDQIEVLEELLRTNPRGNVRLCVTVAARYTESMGGARAVIPIFESVPKVPDALFYYLAAIITLSDEPEVHNRFIEVAIQLNQFDDAHAVTRDSSHYDPERMKNFLKDAKPRDPRPLINVCDRFGFIDELVKYFVRQRQLKFVEGYVQRVNPLRCPDVVAALLDMDAMPERDIKKLILSVKHNVPVNELVGVVESRGKLKLVLEFLESRIADGSTDSSVHTGVAKVYVDTNSNPQHFLETNAFYDSVAVGKYCAKRDPFLAFVAFRRGKCDDELLTVTNDNSLFREQASYAVDRADADLWSRIFADDNPFRRLVVDQVIATALPTCKRPEKVSAAVRAFLAAGMPDVLMEMLEKLVLQTSNTAFSRNTNLQNLLILTAIGAAPERVMEYVRRMDNYDGPDVAPSCIGAGLFEEAYAIYFKFKSFDDALDMLIEHIKDFERAEEFAVRMDRAEVWLKLGVAQLEHGIVGDGIRSLMRAKDASQYALVVDAARYKAVTDDDFRMVSKFCRVARKKIREPESALRAIDTELVHALCRIDALTDVEEFIVTQSHMADLEDAGDRCFDVELYTAAKMMFRAVEAWCKLAHAHVKLGEYKEAVHVAKKAKSIKTWRIVCFACVDAHEFKLASTCALRLLVEVDEMRECVDYYEENGHFTHIMDVLELALNSDRAHVGMFTEMAVLLTKVCCASLWLFRRDLFPCYVLTV
jgi:clathrin heavy chain